MLNSQWNYFHNAVEYHRIWYTWLSAWFLELLTNIWLKTVKLKINPLTRNCNHRAESETPDTVLNSSLCISKINQSTIWTDDAIFIIFRIKSALETHRLLLGRLVNELMHDSSSAASEGFSLVRFYCLVLTVQSFFFLSSFLFAEWRYWSKSKWSDGKLVVLEADEVMLLIAQQ